MAAAAAPETEALDQHSDLFVPPNGVHEHNGSSQQPANGFQLKSQQEADVHPCLEEISTRLHHLYLLRARSSLGEGGKKGHDAQAPIISESALRCAGGRAFPVLSLFGNVLRRGPHSVAEDTRQRDDGAHERLFLNMNAPFSAAICGVQGGGKSHTLAVLLEASLLPAPQVGSLPSPMSILCCHYDNFGSTSPKPCEAAYLSRGRQDLPFEVPSTPTVTVLVSPTCLQTMKKAYAGLHVDVQPFRLAARDLTACRVLSIMMCDESAHGHKPLYMQVLLTILRDMGQDGFNYKRFRFLLSQQKFSEQQKEMLNLRLNILDSIVADDKSFSLQDYVQPGSMIVLDLSDPFLDVGSACALFHIAMGLFVDHQAGGFSADQQQQVGKLVVFDEAHKYLVDQDSELTQNLLSCIRQQRHLGLRVIVVTQEPTVIPGAILDLCGLIIAFRISSPLWASALARHVCSGKDVDSSEWFEEAVELEPGQGILFCPTGLLGPNVEKLARQYLVFHARQRLTLDGGASIVASNVASQD